MARKEDVTTPMMKQFVRIKESYPDDILFFRMGDFYEMFFADAEKAADVLDIVLTSRDGGGGVRVPMAGVPHHSADSYIQRLVDAGYRVAVCEQMEDPEEARGLVEREVIRVITPGARIDAGVVGSKRDNFAAAVVQRGEAFGLAVADISTGHFSCVQVQGDDARRKLIGEFNRLGPVECCMDPAAGSDDGLREQLADIGVLHFPELESWAFGERECEELLCEHFGVASLAGFGCDDRPQAVRAAGSLLRYLRRTQMSSLGQIVTLTTYRVEDHLVIDPVARRTLELSEPLFSDRRGGTLLETLDRTETPMGGRLVRRQMERPLRDAASIEQRLDAVEALVEDPASRERLRDALANIMDLERLAGRVSHGTAGPRDLAALRESLGRIPTVTRVVREIASSGPADGPWAAVLQRMDELSDVREELCDSLREDPPAVSREGGIIRDGYDEQIDDLRENASGGKQWIASLQERERERTGIKSLKVGHNKVFGYYIEVTNPNRDLVPDSYERKQTLVNSERYITPELKEKEAVILGAEERLADLEYEVFVSLRAWVAERVDRLLHTAGELAQVDVFMSLAELAAHNQYCRPEIVQSPVLDVVEGRHPVLEESDLGEPFVPNDCYLDCDKQAFLVVTGPNMSGKSTYLRQVGLIVIMAQMGSFVPAQRARVGLVDQIFTRIGAADDLARGQSTFMMEMTEVANILNNATTHSLLILDEVGRGTSTYDGISIAWATCEYIRRAPHLGCRTLFATHYHELTRLAEHYHGVVNYSVDVREKGSEVVFLRRVVPGPTDRSYGIHVARLAGLPPRVISRANDLAAELEESAAALSSSDAGEEPEVEPDILGQRQEAFRQMSVFSGEEEDDG